VWRSQPSDQDRGPGAVEKKCHTIRHDSFFSAGLQGWLRQLNAENFRQARLDGCAGGVRQIRSALHSFDGQDAILKNAQQLDT
jgi:hypothetical protein